MRVFRIEIGVDSGGWGIWLAGAAVVRVVIAASVVVVCDGCVFWAVCMADDVKVCWFAFLGLRLREAVECVGAIAEWLRRCGGER